MNQQQAVLIVKDIIQGGLRHKNYHRTVEKATEYKAFITGEGITKYIPNFSKREDEEAYKQRVEITTNITETVSGNIIDPQFKLPRSNSIERRLQYTDNDNKKYDEFTRILSKFWENSKSVDDYMSKSWIELNNIDPNAFVVIDWKPNMNGERIKPYPVEYLSEHVVHYNKVNGDLNWVCVHRDEDGQDPEMYILYTKDFTVIYKRKEDPFKWTHKEADVIYYQEFPITGFGSAPIGTMMKPENEFWDIYIPQPHNLGFVPGFFVGFVTDLSTRRTFLSTIHKAFPILKKIVKSNSELDLTMALHAFPQKIQYVSPCPTCHGNQRQPSGEVCDMCHGTGVDPKETHASAQDVLQIPRPRDSQDMVDLSKFIHYVPNDVRLLKFQEEYIFKLTKWCKEAVYNSEVFSRGNIAETAYAKNIDLQNVYDALWPMAKAYAVTYNFIVEAISKITDLNENLIHNLSFRKDFKMKSLSDLYNDLTMIGQSKASEFVRRGVEDDIAQVLYEDDPHGLDKYHTMNYFFPFNGKSSDEIKLIVTQPQLVPKEIRALWANFSYIFDELEFEFKQNKIDFYSISREKQRDAIQKKVKEIIENTDDGEINIGAALQGGQTRVGQTEPRVN